VIRTHQQRCFTECLQRIGLSSHGQILAPSLGSIGNSDASAPLALVCRPTVPLSQRPGGNCLFSRTTLGGCEPLKVPGASEGPERKCTGSLCRALLYLRLTLRFVPRTTTSNRGPNKQTNTQANAGAGPYRFNSGIFVFEQCSLQGTLFT
jgi:hypothetical protein